VKTTPYCTRSTSNNKSSAANPIQNQYITWRNILKRSKFFWIKSTSNRKSKSFKKCCKIYSAQHFLEDLKENMVHPKKHTKNMDGDKFKQQTPGFFPILICWWWFIAIESVRCYSCWIIIFQVRCQTPVSDTLKRRRAKTNWFEKNEITVTFNSVSLLFYGFCQFARAKGLCWNRQNEIERDIESAYLLKNNFATVFVCHQCRSAVEKSVHRWDDEAQVRGCHQAKMRFQNKSRKRRPTTVNEALAVIVKFLCPPKI